VEASDIGSAQLDRFMTEIDGLEAIYKS